MIFSRTCNYIRHAQRHCSHHLRKKVKQLPCQRIRYLNQTPLLNLQPNSTLDNFIIPTQIMRINTTITIILALASHVYFWTLWDSVLCKTVVIVGQYKECKHRDYVNLGTDDTKKNQVETKVYNMYQGATSEDILLPFI